MNRMENEMKTKGVPNSLIENVKSLNQFNDFLKSHYVDDLFYSHQGMDIPRGKFRFSRDNLDKLYKVIPIGHHLAEKPGTYIQIYFDCDIKILKGTESYFFDDGVSHLYSKPQIRDCITSIQSVFMEFGIDSEKLVCCLMEKPIYETDKHVKNGFHLAFPYLFLNKETFVNFIFPKIVNRVKQTSELELDPLNEYTTPWLMYGGTKNKTSKPYLLTKIYNVDFNEMTVDTLTNYKIFDIDENQIIIDRENVDYLLPRIFSINPHHREITEINKNKCVEPLIVVEKKNNFIKTEETTLTDDEIKENIRKIRILLPMINCDTGGKENSFYKWSSVVKNCSFYSGMDDEMFDEIDDWAQGYDCYGKDSKKENKKKFYEEGNNSFCNFGTLVNFAKTDNPAEFEKRKDSIWEKKKDSSPKADVRREIFEKLLKSSTHHSLANIYASYCDNELFFSETCQFVMFDEKTKLWSTNNKKDFLIHKISKFFVDLVDEYVCEFLSDIIEEINKNEKLTAKQKERKIQHHMKVFEKLKNDVGSSLFISQVIKQLQCIIRKDESFLKVLESHPNLFAFSDGKVLDLFKNGEIRNIEKDDFIIKTCGYPYPERNQEDIDELMVKIKTLSDNPEQIKSLLSAMSLSLYGENKNQILIELTGSGGNGKGSIVGLKNKTLGNYSGSLDADIILNMNGKFSIQQQSQIAQNEFCRSVDIVEPNDSFGESVPKLSASTIKSFTGGDPVTGKFYNCDPYKFIARFTPCLQVNDELDTTSDDDGMRRRLKIIKLPLSFVENIGQELKSHERFKELNFSENLKVDKFRNSFLHILVDMWLETNGIFFESELVKETTKEYFESQTPAKDWFLNNYELCDENRINSTQLFNHFKSDVRGVTLTAFGRQISKVCRKIKSHGTLMYFCKLKTKIVSSSSSEINFDLYIDSNES